MVYIGTSGWQYRHWRLSFYSKGVAQARWLEFYADRFQTVELNNSFYRLPSEASFTDWRRRTPDDFVFAVKMSRFLTHQKRLRDPAEPVELFLDRAKHLGSKLGPWAARGDVRAAGPYVSARHLQGLVLRGLQPRRRPTPARTHRIVID